MSARLDERRDRLARAAAIVLLGLGGCGAGTAALAQEMVADRYELSAVDAPDAAEQLARCVGKPVAQTREFLRATLASPDADKARQYGGVDDPAVALLSRGQWACVPLSLARYPEWPVEALDGLIELPGVPRQAAADWSRNMLEQLARSGTARGLVAFDNGNASAIEMKALAGFAGAMSVSMKNIKTAGADESGYHAVLKDAGLKSIGMTTHQEIRPPAGTAPLPTATGRMPGDAQWAFMIPQKRLRWPVDGEFARVAPVAATAAVAVEGSRWGDAAGAKLWLQPAGMAVYSTARSTDSGTWAVENGVLHVRLGGGSRFALTPTADGKALAGRARRTLDARGVPGIPSSALGEDEREWQWALRLDKQ